MLYTSTTRVQKWHLRSVVSLLLSSVVIWSCDHWVAQELSEEKTVLSLGTILNDPGAYKNKEVRVRGVLMWHENEPVLFADDLAYRNLNFRNSIQLSAPREILGAEPASRNLIIDGIYVYYDDATHGGGRHDFLNVKSFEIDPMNPTQP